MKEFLDFLLNHWRIVAVLVVHLITFIILLCKRKVKVDDVFKSVLTQLPDFINIAESRFKTGAEKYAYVFNRCIELLETLTHHSGQDLLNKYTAQIDASIEHILSTPQKKER